MTITPNKWELDVQGYLNTCNITAATPRKQIRDFSAGVNDLGLWNSMVCWPLRSSQNYGSGDTVFSLGGLGTFNGTRVGGPTWEADGIDFVAASNTHITTPLDVAGLRQFTTMVATDPSSYVAADALVSAWNVLSTTASYFILRRFSSAGIEPVVRSSGSVQREYIANQSQDWRVYGFGTQGASSRATASGSQIGTGIAFVPDQSGAQTVNIGILTPPANSPYNGKIGWVFFIKDAELTTAQQLLVYDLYKTTLGQGITFP
jgi:hypothetical protein